MLARSPYTNSILPAPTLCSAVPALLPPCQSPERRRAAETETQQRIIAMHGHKETTRAAVGTGKPPGTKTVTTILSRLPSLSSSRCGILASATGSAAPVPLPLPLLSLTCEFITHTHESPSLCPDSWVVAITTYYVHLPMLPPSISTHFPRQLSRPLSHHQARANSQQQTPHSNPLLFCRHSALGRSPACFPSVDSPSCARTVSSKNVHPYTTIAGTSLHSERTGSSLFAQGPSWCVRN